MGGGQKQLLRVSRWSLDRLRGPRQAAEQVEGWGREEVGVVRPAMWGGQEEDVWWRDCSIRPLSCLEGRPACGWG